MLRKAVCIRELAGARMDSPLLCSTLDEFGITFRCGTEAESAGNLRGCQDIRHVDQDGAALHQGIARRGLAGVHWHQKQSKEALPSELMAQHVDRAFSRKAIDEAAQDEPWKYVGVR